MIPLILIIQADTCTIYGTFNPTITILDPHSQSALYLAYKVYYINWNVGKYLQRYISMDVPVGQTKIIATFFGGIDKICTDEANNIVGSHAVAKVIDLFEINDLVIAASYFVITDSIFRRCYMKDNNGVEVFIEITPDLNNYILDILPTQTLQTYTFDFSSCETRVNMELTPQDGMMHANTKDVIFPVFNHKLKEYGSDYGDFLYPIVFINSTISKDKGLFSTPTNAIKGEYDVIEISSSILFGREYLNPMQYVMAGNDSRFENITISGKCVQFYANSPRNIEYPLMSGIIHSIQSHSSALDAGSKVYTQYYGPKVCVQNFVYMPVFFLTTEDPALKKACDRLPEIQANFTQHVKDGTWEYLDSIDKNPITPYNDQAITFTQTMIDKLQSTCHKAYFLPNYSKNLAYTISIVDILFFVILISTITIQFVITKRNSTNDVFTKISNSKERKRLYIEIFVAISLMVIIIILTITITQYIMPLLIIIIIFSVTLIMYSFHHYVRISDQQNLGDINVVEVQLNIKTRIGVIILQFIIQVIVEILEILLNITDILQMLQYMKFQYYQNRITNIRWLINPANLILQTAQSLGKGVYPFIFLMVSLVNQELMKGEWFKKLIRKPEDPLNMNIFLLMKLLKLFQYFQGFTYNIFFAFTNKSLKITYFTNQNTNNNFEVIIKLFLAGTLYSISKYNLLLEYYEQINKAIIKMFITLAQIQANIFTIIGAPIRITRYLVTRKWKEISDSIKISLLALVSTIYYVIMLPLDPIITILTPTTLMLHDFMFPCPFLLQILGIVDHQNVLAKQTSILLARDIPSIIRRVFISIQAGAVAIFFSLLFTQDQNATINPTEQWHCFIFASAMLLTSIVSTNQIGQVIAKQQSKFNNPVLQLQVSLSESQRSMYKSLLSVNGNYEHVYPPFEVFLRKFIFAGYGNIPGCGPLLSCTAKYFGATCLASNGMWRFQVEIVWNVIQFVFIILTVYWALKIDQETVFFLGWFSVYMIIQLCENWKEVIESYDQNLTITSILTRLYMKMFKNVKTNIHKQNDSKIDSNNNINISKEDYDLKNDLKNDSKQDSKTDLTNEVSVSVVVNEGTVLAHSANETKDEVENGAESNLEDETVSNESEK
ncbi:Conserved_hypothetical protein [Hexamita inflata]|uniref:Uncharacterized protein n=1 Tax=Hexamita inflata TaxID=28002 RepID=A0AA86RIA4_9EUKA|nr:Conserved hypothetical protein [Hexamita inflata]